MKDYEYYYENGTRSTIDPSSDLTSGTGAPVQDLTNGTNVPSPRAKKERKPFGLKAAALLAAACVLLSGAVGFGGSLLAARLQRTAAPAAPAEEAEEAAEAETEEKVKSAPSMIPALEGTPVVNLDASPDVETSTSGTPGGDMSYAQVAALVKDSVVEINTEYTTRNMWFQYATGGAGSGVILTEEGYIVTNAHVILDENMQNVADSVTVRLTDGTEYPAEVVSYDTDEDIAVLKIDAKDLTAARCGDSDRLAVGEEVVIVGNPLGELGGTVTNGIVSATEREIQVGGVTMRLVQTNAAVNPGNSGGGMFNLKGELVGIVNAKSSGTGIEGLGFAIPINQAMRVSEQLMTKGYVGGKPMIGVSLRDVSGSSYLFGGSSGMKEGVYVAGLVEGMNDKVLAEGDRIIAVNGEEISSSEDVKAKVYAASIGDKLLFQLYRDGKLTEAEVTVFERTPDMEDASTDASPDGKDADPGQIPGRRGDSGRSEPGRDWGGSDGNDGYDGYDDYDGYEDFGDLDDFSKALEDFFSYFGGR